MEEKDGADTARGINEIRAGLREGNSELYRLRIDLIGEISQLHREWAAAYRS